MTVFEQSHYVGNTWIVTGDMVLGGGNGFGDGLDGKAGDSGLVLSPLFCSAVPWHWPVLGSYLPKSSQGTLPPSFGSEEPHGPSEAAMAQAIGMAGQ